MEGWVTTIITVVVSALITTIISTIVGRSLKKRFEKKDEEERIIKQEEDTKNRETIVKVLREELKPVTDTIDKLNDKLDKIGEGTLSSLRNDILTCYYKCHDKGYRNDYDFQNIHDLYEAYKALDGNSFVADIMVRFDNLPTKEEFREEQRTELDEIKRKPNKLAPKSTKKKGE